eukprot:6827528-Ditylum_brightwellii.AAC.1
MEPKTKESASDDEKEGNRKKDEKVGGSDISTKSNPSANPVSTFGKTREKMDASREGENKSDKSNDGNKTDQTMSSSSNSPNAASTFLSSPSNVIGNTETRNEVKKKKKKGPDTPPPFTSLYAESQWGRVGSSSDDDD